ncbi:MAG: AbrB/MazE/SpoVT family DNA-binding domain-containing protein [Pseudomonadota bacterium]|jgi:AbrB family looped-hinge helix DNA binding protein
MSDTAPLSEKFQISVPKAMRETQGWRPGQKLVFISKGAGVMLIPVPTTEELFGLGKGASPEGYRDRP